MLWTTFFVKGTEIPGELNEKIASTSSLVITSSLYLANIFAPYIYISNIYNMSCRVVSGIQTRAEGEWLYI